MAIKIPWWDRLNSALIPHIGPPPLGPYGAPVPIATVCPLCGAEMAAHDIERREKRPTQVHCPVS